MVRPFALPDLGEGIHEGEVVAVLVSEGDSVQEGQPILQVETDKACVDIPSPATGTVQEIRVKPNDIVKVGTVLVVFSTGESLAGGVAGPEEAHQARRASEVTDRATATPQAKAAREAGLGAGSEPTVGSGPMSAAEPASRSGPVPAAPSTRRLARELGVELRAVRATGPAGLVTADDVRAHAAAASNGTAVAATTCDDAHADATQSASSQDAPATGQGPESVAEGERLRQQEALRPGVMAAPPLPDFGRWGPVEVQPLRSVRRATAAHMALAWAQIPHVNHQEVADVTQLEEFRRSSALEVESAGGKLTMTVLMMKAVVAALKEHPRFNSSLDMANENVVLKHYYHVGVAVDTERGLIVPVIRDVDRKSVLELSVELKNVAERARDGKTPLEEMQGGCFTITNIGAIGGTGFAPIINYPEAAILGMGRARMQPVVMGDEGNYRIVPRLQMPLVLAFDHRVLDGADAARFMRTLVSSLENPSRLWVRM